MLFIDRIFLLILFTCLLSASPTMAGDAASGLPASLVSSLRPIKDVKLDDLDTQARDSIQLARQELNEALQAQPMQIDRLAAAYGELGALYQVRFVFPAA